MYYDFFGLDQAPYKMTPDIKNFYRGGQRGAILDALVYAVSRGEAITKVVGEVGSGKTMLCCMLASQLSPKVNVVYLAHPNIKPDDVLKAISIELGLSVGVDVDRLQVMKNLHEFLLKKHAEGQQVVVLIEEAHQMPLETLEEIRLLSNLETQHNKLLQIVLFAQPELDKNLALPQVRQIKDRITNSFYLPALRRDEVYDYLIFKLHRAGCCEYSPFNRGAVNLLAWASKGLFRRVNVLADKSLLAAFSDHSKFVNKSHVRAAVSDVEFSPRKFFMRPAFSVCTVALMMVWFVLHGGGQGHINTWVDAVKNEATVHIAPVNDQKNEKSLSSQIVKNVVLEAKLKKADYFQDRLNTTKRWLDQAKPGHFTIQILVTENDNKKGLERFFKQQMIHELSGKLADQLYLHRENVRGEVMLSVTYGEFSSFGEAQAELNNLPDVLQANRPYLRNVGQVMGAVQGV